MPVSAWIERIASDLLDLEAELRPLMRAQRQHQDADPIGPPPGCTHQARYDSRRVVLSANEARTLLRAAMPFPVSSTRLREPHARMLAALALFSGHLLSLNDPLADQRHAAAAACALVDELRGWIAQARWTQACRAAGVRWRFEPAAQLPIIPITQHQTATGEEQPANTLAALAAAHQVRADPMGHQTARTARRRSAAAIAAQDALQLAQEADAGPPARVVPLRPAAATSAPPDLATRRRSA